MEPESRKLTAPYLAFKTFLNALDQLAAHGMPSRIDRTVFPSFNGVTQSQLLSAFRFLHLIDEDGTPTPALEALALEKDKRKENVRKLIENRYPDIAAIDFSRMIPSQLDNKLSGDSYGVGGETKQKAKTFLIKAAEFAGFSISPLLKKGARSVGGGRRKKVLSGKQTANGQDSGSSETEKRDSYNPPSTSGTTKTIQLKKGGSLTLSMEVNLLELEGSDREFVFSLIDKLKAYETGESPPLKSSTAEQ
jgi:hypothetical protein